MAPTEGRVANSCRRWARRHGTPYNLAKLRAKKWAFLLRHSVYTAMQHKLSSFASISYQPSTSHAMHIYFNHHNNSNNYNNSSNSSRNNKITNNTLVSIILINQYTTAMSLLYYIIQRNHQYILSRSDLLRLPNNKHRQQDDDYNGSVR